MEIGRLEDAVEVSLSGRERLRQLGLAGYWPDSFLLANAVEALYKLGRWDEANELTNQALANAQPPFFSETPFPPLLAAAMIEVGRGEFQTAEAHLEAVKDRSLAGVADLAREYTALVAELRLWQGRLQEARAAVQDGLDRVAGTDEQMRSGRLLCLGCGSKPTRPSSDVPATIPTTSTQPSVPRTPWPPGPRPWRPTHWSQVPPPS